MFKTEGKKKKDGTYYTPSTCSNRSCGATFYIRSGTSLSEWICPYCRSSQ